jgi:hypothetical protein
MRPITCFLALAVCWLAPSRSFAAQAAADLRSQARALVDRWVALQNQRDLKAWSELYDQRRFTGIRTWAFQDDFSDWREYREAALADRPVLGVDHVTVELWSDAETGLREGRIRVLFDERCQYGRFADHGPRRLELEWNEPRRTLLIVLEERATDRDGLADPVVAPVAVSFAPPATLEQAWATWRRLPIRGSNVEGVLAGVTARTSGSPHTARLLALAALAHVTWDCPLVQDDPDADPEAATTTLSRPFHPDAGIDDPCVARPVALWAIGRRELLRESDLPVIGGALEAMLAEENKDELDLQLAAAAVASRFTESTRYRLMTKSEEVAADLLRLTLSAPFLARAAIELHDGAAAVQLDPHEHREAVLHALADSEVGEEARIWLIGRIGGLYGPDVDAALIEASTEPSCRLVMFAGAAMARRGDPSMLPQRSDDEALNRIELCRLVFDPDHKRRLATWRTFLPPKGSVNVVRAGDGGCSQEPWERVRRVTRATASLRDLGEDARFEFERRAGHLYVSEVRYEDNRGCD